MDPTRRLDVCFTAGADDAGGRDIQDKRLKVRIVVAVLRYIPIQVLYLRQERHAVTRAREWRHSSGPSRFGV